MRLNKVMKRAAIAAGRLLPRADPARRRVVLCYHSIHPARPYVSTRPDLFERHVEWLREHCRITSLVDLVAEGTQTDGKPTVAITFDDGYEDNHSSALPILARHGVPATFFVTAGFVNRDPSVLHRFENFLNCRPEDIHPLEWAQVRELRDSGMHIGSHTYSHANLARCSDKEADEELRVSRSLLSERLGDNVDLFAYPFGKPNVHFTASTVERVKAAGYRIAASVTYRPLRSTDSPLQIPRMFADGDSVAKLAAKINGSHDPVGWWQEHAPVSLMKRISPDDFQR